MTATETSTLGRPDVARLHLLGRAELAHDHSGESGLVRFLPERRFRLLAYLAVRGEWVSRDELATFFWPDRTQDAARSNLRKLLQEARALALPQLEADRDSVRWTVSTDVAEYRAALGRGDTDAALALYRGQALPGLEGGESEAFNTWLTVLRRRLHAAWRDAALAQLPHRGPAATLALAQRLLDDDPLDEDAMVAALDAHGEIGDSRGAADAFRRYAERLIEELGVEPSARVRLAATRRATLATPQALAAEAPLTALTFIGREGDLRELEALLANPDCRALTVIGPGGMGKSRLAKQVARELAANYIDGVTWIALDDLTDTAQVAPRIAVELALALDPAKDPIASIAGQLASRQLLLVLDNCEHLPCLSALLDPLIGAAPRLQLLATSRSRIGIRDEWLLPLQGLALPSPNSASHDSAAAMQMFVAHARAADPRFDAEANAPHIARLVRAVGGLPLAILLAASWVRLLPMAELANDVTQSLDVLESADEGEERAEHRSMRATFEQSWRLLAPAEQRALAALSVFAGGFSRSAALAVAGAPVVLLSSLVDKSLLQVDMADDAASRFHLHPLLRHFARSKMRAVDEWHDLMSRHTRYFARWLAETEQALRGPEQPKALAELEQKLPDCHAAWGYAVEQRDAQFIECATLALMYYYEARGRRTDGIALLSAAERALDAADEAAAGALAMLARALSTLRYFNGEMALTIDTATRGIALARRAGASPALKGCLLNLGLAHYQRGQLDQARTCCEEALALARADRDLPGLGALVNSLAMVEQETGDRAAAEAHYREGLRIFRELQNARGTVTALNNLGLMLLDGKRVGEALPLYEEGLRLCAQHGIEVMRGNCLFGLGGARLALGQLPAARDLTQQALVAAQASGEPYVAVEAQMQLARIALAANDATQALRLAHQALGLAARLENLPVLLDTVHCIAECRVQAGDARGAVTLWLFLVAHPQSSDADRLRVRPFIDNAALSGADRAWAQEQAQRVDLSGLADALEQERDATG
ncbi:MAG: tetratricopeptide repeat protein [Betaproteobacteria bacterium]